MEEIPKYINMLSYLFVVVYMLSVQLETARGEIIKTLGHLNLMGRALLANFVIIPICGILIRRFFALPPEIRTGFLLLVIAPGGLLALQFARISNGNRVFAVALLFVFCLLAGRRARRMTQGGSRLEPIESLTLLAHPSRKREDPRLREALQVDGELIR